MHEIKIMVTEETSKDLRKMRKMYDELAEFAIKHKVIVITGTQRDESKGKDNSGKSNEPK